MNYKEQIEQKAGEKYPINNFYGDFDSENKELRAAYITGAEAMREIVNTWIDIKETPPELKENPYKILVVNKPDNIMVIEEVSFRQGIEVLKREFTHWKPITL